MVSLNRTSHCIECRLEQPMKKRLLLNGSLTKTKQSKKVRNDEYRISVKFYCNGLLVTAERKTYLEISRYRL